MPALKNNLPKHWAVTVAIGGLVGLAAAGPVGVLVGGGLAWLLDWGLERRHAFPHVLADAARAMIGSPADSLAVTAVVGLPPSGRPNWCALFVQGLVRRAAQTNRVPPPIAGSPGALATMQQFKDADPTLAQWVEAKRFLDGLQTIQPGDVPIWTRDPPAGQEWAGEGHIGIAISALPAGRFSFVDGNDGPAIAVHQGDIHSPKFLGAGRFV